MLANGCSGYPFDKCKQPAQASLGFAGIDRVLGEFNPVGTRPRLASRHQGGGRVEQGNVPTGLLPPSSTALRAAALVFGVDAGRCFGLLRARSSS